MNTSRRQLTEEEEMNQVTGGFFLTGLAIIGISTGIGLIAAGITGMILEEQGYSTDPNSPNYHVNRDKNSND